MKSYQMEDGRWHHRLRQSWLKTSTICLERARLEHVNAMPEDETDAANIGSAVHTAIETCLSCDLTLADTLEVFDLDFTERMEHDAWRWVKYTEKTARRFGEYCVTQWHLSVLPTLMPEEAPLLEEQFCLSLLEDDARVIELSGTIDYFDGTLRDWKTSGRKWEKWEHERWDVQPSVYTWAARKLGWLTEPEPWPFEFVVLGGKSVQRITVTRRVGDHIWLQEKCVEAAQLIELQLAHWPTNDTHALCSPKWCPAWDACKGKYVAATWPR